MVPAAGPAQGVEAATAKFKAGIGGFQALIDELVASVERERQELKQSREQLEQERQQFEEESQRVQQVLSDSEKVSLAHACGRAWLGAWRASDWMNGIG